MSLQVPDWITFRGRHRQLFSFPLDAYLRNLPQRPAFRLGGHRHNRGYVASWDVRDDDTLWLTGLITRAEDDGPDPGTRLVFPAPGPVSATWVRLSLLTLDPEQRRYSPIGNDTTYARELWLSVWCGRLVAVEEFDARAQHRV